VKLQLEKLGTVGAVLAAILCPICFPKLALIGAIFGLGFLSRFEGWFSVASQILLVVACLGHFLIYRRHRNKWVLALALFGTLLVLGSLWIHYVEALVYLGLIAVVAATVWGTFAMKRCVTCAAPLSDNATGT
jgi:mercuric ion transport protein